MKAIFLDVDGVLNNFSLIRQNGFDYIDPSMVGLVGQVVRRTEAEIVLSSTWRIMPEDRAMVVDALRSHGLSLHGSTPSIYGPRSNEIAEWLRENGSVERYAILDDEDDAGIGMGESFFQTDPEVGLTSSIADRVALHLNGGFRA